MAAINKTITTEYRIIERKDQRTYPADCRKIAAVDSNKHDWD